MKMAYRTSLGVGVYACFLLLRPTTCELRQTESFAPTAHPDDILPSIYLKTSFLELKRRGLLSFLELERVFLRLDRDNRPFLGCEYRVGVDAVVLLLASSLSELPLILAAVVVNPTFFHDPSGVLGGEKTLVTLWTAILSNSLKEGVMEGLDTT